MTTETVSKLIKKVNFDYAIKFDIQRTKELSFVPVNIQNSTFFVGISPESDKVGITQYVKLVFGARAGFIYLTKESFVELWEAYLDKHPTVNKQQTEAQSKTLSDVASVKNVEKGTKEQVNNEADNFADNLDLSDVSVIELEPFDEIEIEPLDVVDDIIIAPSPNSPKPVLAQMQQQPQASQPSRPLQAAPQTQMQPSGQVNKQAQVQPQRQSLPPQQAQPAARASNQQKFQQPQKPQQAQQQFTVQNSPTTPPVLGNPPLEPRKIDKIKNPEKKRIGDIFIEEGIITEKQLQMALAESKATDTPLGSVLVKLGFVKISDLKDALAAQQGVQLASSEQLRSIPDSVKILPEDFIRLNKVIPLSLTNKVLVVGMVNPGDTATVNEIVYLTGFKPTVMMITHFEFDNFIKQYFKDSLRESESLMTSIQSESSGQSGGETLWEQVEKDVQDTSGTVAKFANKIITDGIDTKVSDIHIEPRFDGYVVRYRKDGILQEALRIPAGVDSAVIARFKVLSKMDIAEHRRPQDGNFTIKYKKESYDFRINTLPVAGKEKIVIRILAPAASLAAGEKTALKIDGMTEEQLDRIKVMTSSPNGVILTSGPTGSGKTTTLYSLIRALNDESVNITTIEDPVEIKLEGINQSPVNVKAGVTFASCMRAILRQDPDIILVGELRDQETLETAISAALTGHLVLSTIHTNSAAATVTRMVEMGAKDYMVASTLTGVLAQRLVRRVCKGCREEYTPTVDDAKKITTNPDVIKQLTSMTLYRAKGCEQCEEKGYKGRIGIYEVMAITKDIRKLITNKASEIEIEEFAINNGMETLSDSCINHIKNGLTTIEEFVRVLGLATD